MLFWIWMYVCVMILILEGVVMLKGFNGCLLEVNMGIIMLIFVLKEVIRDKEIGKYWFVI